MCEGLKGQFDMDRDRQVATRPMTERQLRSFIGQMGIGENQFNKEHRFDIFHDDDEQGPVSSTMHALQLRAGRGPVRRAREAIRVGVP